MKTKIPNLSEIEIAVLKVLAEAHSEERCIYFRGIAEDTKLDVHVVRRACRSLTRKGYAEYIRGLFDEDGMVAGSGYTATSAGACRSEVEGNTYTTPEEKLFALQSCATTSML